MQVTTPTGWRLATAEMSPPGANGVVGMTAGGSGVIVGSRAPLA